MADRIKTAFRSRILTESAQLIRKQQQETLVEWDLVSSGQLLRQMRGHFSVSDMETGARLDMTYLSYMRFLDIPNARRSLREAKRQGYATLQPHCVWILVQPNVAPTEIRVYRRNKSI